jgi:Cu+-exporting ATPase
MKRLFGTELVIVLLVIVIGGGLGWARHRLFGTPDEANAVITIFEVEGMDCTNCETGVHSKLMALDGVIQVTVSYVDSSAEVKHDPALVTPEKIAEVITATGFPARPLDGQL